MSTTETAVAKLQNSPAQLIRDHRNDIAQVLPTHIKPETFVRVAVGVVNRDRNLRAAAENDPGSLMVALLDAARQGLEPGTEQYYLTVRGGKVLGVRGYQGEIELIYRAGAVSSVIVEAVYTGDTFVWAPGKVDDHTPKRWDGAQTRPFHEVDWFGDRGKLLGAYAYAIMKDGTPSKVVVADQRRIKRAMEASATAGKSHSPWSSDPEAMYLKTAVHDLRKFVPTSAEYLRSRQEQPEPPVSVGATSWQPPGVDTVTGEVVDGVVVEDEPDWPEVAQPGGES